MSLKCLDHYTVHTALLDSTVHFYGDILGMLVGDRPAGATKGAWLCIDGHAAVHLVVVDPGLDHPGSGAVDHVAFAAEGLESMRDRLAERRVPFELVDHRPNRPLAQLYLQDPNGVRIELNFALTDT